MAETEPATRSNTWDGLSELRRIAEAAGHPFEIPGEVSITGLGPKDALLLIHPTVPLPVAELAAFLRKGGRLAILDEYGTGDTLLAAFQIAREPIEVGERGLHLRDNPELLLARPTGSHPLTRDIRAIATNHPIAVRHNGLEPVFIVGRATPLALTGAVGTGRLIALGDSSLFINDMLRVEGNRTLARNLLSYLADGRGGRLILATDATPLEAPLHDRLTAPAHAMASLLDRMSRVQLPAAWLLMAAVVTLVTALVWLGGLVLLRSPYAHMTLFARAPLAAGYSGRVDYFSRAGASLSQPLLAFRVELEAELRRRLATPPEAGLHQVLSSLRASSASGAIEAEARQLFATIDEMALQEERAHAPVHVSIEQFRALVRSGERILAAVMRQEPVDVTR